MFSPWLPTKDKQQTGYTTSCWELYVYAHTACTLLTDMSNKNRYCSVMLLLRANGKVFHVALMRLRTLLPEEVPWPPWPSVLLLLPLARFGSELVGQGPLRLKARLKLARSGRRCVLTMLRLNSRQTATVLKTGAKATRDSQFTALHKQSFKPRSELGC